MGDAGLIGRVLSVPLVVGWVLINVATNVLVPPLEEVGEAHTVGLRSQTAPAMISMKRIGADFDTMKKMQSFTAQMADTTHSMVLKTTNMTVDIAELRDHIAGFDDFLRPFATTSTGNRTATTSRRAGRSARCSTHWTGSTP
ncbi:membrane protein [Mycolicibacterium canariasense]|uniref:Membrane protein n=1 Tax=Mycolicibacterium canariasense TaxID=228230 RepID=A0A100WF48_MYCCR|nr:membrane protein [Mycolicibacterium canariasense]